MVANVDTKVNREFRWPPGNTGSTCLCCPVLRMYSDLASDHQIDLARYQVANCYMGRAGLINSGGASGANDLPDAVRTAVINKRAVGHRHLERLAPRDQAHAAGALVDHRGAPRFVQIVCARSAA